MTSRALSPPRRQTESRPAHNLSRLQVSAPSPSTAPSRCRWAGSPRGCPPRSLGGGAGSGPHLRLASPAEGWGQPGTPILLHPPVGDLRVGEPELPRGQIRNTWFLRSPNCKEGFMVRAIIETVQRCGRAERARAEGVFLLWVGSGRFRGPQGPEPMTLSQTLRRVQSFLTGSIR